MLRPSVSTDTKRPDWCETAFYLDAMYKQTAPDTAITAYESGDGADDTPAWGQRILNVQIDTDDTSPATGIVIHLNDSTIYEGNPEVHENAAEVLRQVRRELRNDGDGDGDPLAQIEAALLIIKRSGVVL